MKVYSKLINPHNNKEIKEQKELLHRVGIRLDPLVDWSLALYNEQNKMVATASCFDYTLRSIAVDEDYQGQGLMAKLLTEVEKEANRRGLDRLLLIAQAKDRQRFSAVGFTLLARNSRGLALMENSASHFESFVQELETGLDNLPVPDDKEKILRSGVVINANPFTKGHQYLVEKALEQSDQLLVLLLSDDSTVGFPFSLRYDMALAATKKWPQVLVKASGPYAVSTATFPTYFYPPDSSKAAIRRIKDEAELDAALYVRIANRLNISQRFVGSETTSSVTDIYNQVLQKELSQGGIKLHLVERAQIDGEAISASRARLLLQEGKYSEARKLLPNSTVQLLPRDFPIHPNNKL